MTDPCTGFTFALFYYIRCPLLVDFHTCFEDSYQPLEKNESRDGREEG